MNSIEQDLPAPRVDGVVDGMLDPASVPESGAMARITNVPVSWDDETLTLSLQEVQGQILYQTTWPIGPHGRDINLPIPKDALVANRDKDVQVYYSVTGVGASHPLEFKLGQGFGGAFEFDLAPHNYQVLYINSEARPPKEIPPFARMQRVMPGATRYSSSDEKIATVDAFGIVIARCNGQTTITASGSANGPDSYVLTVTGIGEFHVLSSAVTWEGAQQLCTQTGLVQPSLADFSRFMQFYPLNAGLEHGLPDYPAWGMFIGAGTAYTLDLNTGDVSSAGTGEFNYLQAVGVSQSS
ncbi:hypothetical protein [Pseudomonas sp. Marseille-P9899]|uniref:hypothetical protein n=1 Tax=Pseudomonas sp. Marseille-P9899 TaxID=2730401 RepID=UPI0015889D90|nr:hypothetical protein [Pseudomonas sp. Marseille-P9899]